MKKLYCLAIALLFTTNAFAFVKRLPKEVIFYTSPAETFTAILPKIKLKNIELGECKLWESSDDSFYTYSVTLGYKDELDTIIFDSNPAYEYIIDFNSQGNIEFVARGGCHLVLSNIHNFQYKIIHKENFPLSFWVNYAFRNNQIYVSISNFKDDPDFNTVIHGKVLSFY